MNSMFVILETGSKRTIASAADWPGWCRAGRDESTALLSLLEYGPRYAMVTRLAGIEFESPADVSAFTVSARVKGNATTDFGAPAIVVDSDREAVSQSESKRWTALLQACWQVFDDAAKRAVGRELRKGPRGGGRELEAIIGHVLEADDAYLKRLAWKQKPPRGKTAMESLRNIRDEMSRALEAVVRDGVPAQGPRGGVTWPPRYFVRRVAWHVLDHAWEIEDRIS